MTEREERIADLETRIAEAEREQRSAMLAWLEAVVAERAVAFEHAERVRDAAALRFNRCACGDPQAPALDALRDYHEAELRQAASAHAHAEQVRDAFARYRAVADADDLTATAGD